MIKKIILLLASLGLLTAVVPSAAAHDERLLYCDPVIDVTCQWCYGWEPGATHYHCTNPGPSCVIVVASDCIEALDKGRAAGASLETSNSAGASGGFFNLLLP